MSVPVIAVDGPTASGKGTLARRIAAALDFAHLDTGTLYRAVAAKLLEAGESPDDADAATRAAEVLVAEDLDRADLRQESVSQAASRRPRPCTGPTSCNDIAATPTRWNRTPKPGAAGAR